MYKLLAIAGTFDHLHKGHRYIIGEAFKLGKEVLIGVTSDLYAQKKLHVSNDFSMLRLNRAECPKLSAGEIHITPQIQSFMERKEELEQYLREQGLSKRARIVKIDDVYGPAVDSVEIEALVVTKETLEGGRRVNSKRLQQGMKPLKLIQIPMIVAEDRKRISSTRIRIGEIDRWGRVFIRLDIYSHPITEELRYELKKPQGILVKGSKDSMIKKIKNIVGITQKHIIITVGDEVTKLCNQIGIKPNLAVIDYKVSRIKKYHSLAELGFLHSKALKTPQGWQAAGHDSPGVEESVVRLRNPAGCITRSLVKKMAQAIKKVMLNGEKQIIKVFGEDDLAGVPAILLSPLGSVVLYGQPKEGIVAVEVTEEKKQELFQMIQKLS